MEGLSALFALVQDIFIDYPFYFLAAGILAVIYYTSLPQDVVYKRFTRMGSTVFQWTPVHETVQNGYNKITKPSDVPFVVRWWAKDYLILPAKYMADIRTAGWEHLSFFRNINDALFLHTTVGDLYTSPEAERMVNVVKKGLNPRLPHMTDIMLAEINDAFEKQVAKSKKDSTETLEVKAMDFFSQIVHQLATRIIIGPELCRNESFLNSTTALLNSIFVTALITIKLPLGPFRGMLAYLTTLPHKWKLQKCAKMLRPIVAARIERREKMGEKKTEEFTSDSIEWTLDLRGSSPEYDTVDYITEELLHNLWAASSAPGGLMTQVVYQLLHEPQYIEPLRNEAKRAVDEYGWSEKTLSKLHLQDSFIREVNRLFPTGSVTASRTVVGRPFQFSDGLTLPVGTRFGFPIKAIQCDASNFSDPLVFNGFRFAQDASSEQDMTESSRRWTATAMASTNLAWGYGNHTCPGRFITVRQTKLILTKLLLEYEMSWNRDSSLGRPAPVNIEGQFVPNLAQTIRLRRRVRCV
ncbi:cytochrome P450 [Lojkania enalia]|uniref:Cytochrome P450 n=1 Tax=Lojkania enalia TaxID=147567 RepID=A0A9P4N8I7_9PLEO|nr:cytochrome P450 [Didymosphaeria enalia]